MKEPFLEDLSKAQPNPGGGAAAAYGASLAVALLEKIVRLELARHSADSSERRAWDSRLEQARELAVDFLGLRDKDVQAYMQLAKARAAGKESPLSLAALDGAIRCPVEIIEKVRPALLLLSDAGKQCKKHLLSDLQVACEFLGAAIQGAYHIACANLPLVFEASKRERILENLRKAQTDARNEYERVGKELAERLCRARS